MRLNLPMLAWALRRARAGRAGDIRALAARTWEICPAERATAAPAIHPEGALERIAALSPWRSWEVERALIAGGPVEHAASRAHLIEDVDLSDAFLYRGAAKAQVGYGRERMIVPGGARAGRLGEAHLVSNWAGSHFFGNYLLDDYPLGMIPAPGETAIVMKTRGYGHDRGYRDLLGLPLPREVTAARIGRLTLFTDFAQNSFKAARYRELRRRMRAALGEAGASGPGVYIKRGATGEPRLLANEAQIEARLRDLGFGIVEPAALDAAEIARRTLGARIVVSVEGSHLSHAIYTIADDGAFLVLQPPDRFAMAYKEFADRLDLRFAFLVGAPAPGGFTIDPDDLDRMTGALA